MLAAMMMLFGRSDAAPDARAQTAEAAQKPNLFLVTIGINNYQSLKPGLHYSRVDADAIVKFFKTQEGKIYDRVYPIVLYDNNATKAKILEAIKQPARAQDMMIIYFAGHGIGIERKYYFLPYETPSWDNAIIKQYGVSNDDITTPLVQNEARKQLLLLDTCESGTLVVAMRGGGSEERAVDQLNKTTGAHIISAANEAQGAGETRDLGHGFFTYALLEGLSGKADSNKNGVIEIFELLPFVSSEVKEIAAKYKVEQQPLVRMSGEDFPVAVY